MIITKRLGYRKKYIQDLYDLENRTEDTASETEEELKEDDKGPTKLKSLMVKAIKDMQRKRPLEMTIHQYIYSRGWETID
jgi:hypothetical protein